MPGLRSEGDDSRCPSRNPRASSPATKDPTIPRLVILPAAVSELYLPRTVTHIDKELYCLRVFSPYCRREIDFDDESFPKTSGVSWLKTVSLKFEHDTCAIGVRLVCDWCATRVCRV